MIRASRPNGTWKLSALILVALSVSTVTLAGGTDLIDRLLGEAKVKRCGIQKLTPEERANLSQVFASFLAIAKENELGDSAIEHLKQDGWKEIRILGTKRMRIDPEDEDEEPEEYTVAEEGPWTYIMEPQGFATLTPGKYLGKMSIANCEIIGRDGDAVEFWTKDQR